MINNYSTILLIEEIQSIANTAIGSKGFFYLVISGGNSIIDLINNFKKINSDFSKWNITLVDERLGNDKILFRSNENEFFPKLNQLGCNTFSLIDKADIVQKWCVDLAILGIGEDGHVASLFPSNLKFDIQEDKKIYSIINSPKPPHERITMSYNFLSTFENIFLLMIGKNKSHLIKQVENIDLPFVVVGKMPNTKIFSDNG